MHRFSAAHLGLRYSFSRQGTHEGGVNCELRAPEQGQTVHDNFESPLVQVDHKQIEIENENIHSDPSACFLADLCCHVLQWKSTTTQHPSNWTRRPMMAKAVKETATSARANSEGERLTETTQEEQPERLRIDARNLVYRHADERS